MPSIGLDSSALMTLAMDAPRNRGAFQKFSGILTRMSRTEIPSTPPDPTDDPDDPLNATVSVFQALTRSMLFGFLRSAGSPAGGSLYSGEANKLVIRIMPYLTNWITYFVVHIILPNRESEFCDDLAQLLATLLAGFADAERHPMVYREILSLRAPKELRSQGNRFFLGCILPVLLFHDTSSSSSSREEVVLQCFSALGYLLNTNPSNLPPQTLEVYNALKTEPETLADLFQSSVIMNIGRLRASNLHISLDDLQHMINSLATIYRGVFEFLTVKRVTDRLVNNGHVRWTCELLCAISESKRLRQIVKSSEFSTLARRGLLTISNACVMMAYQHLDRLILIFGHVARQAYKGKAVLSIVRMQHLMSQAYPELIDSANRDISVNTTASFLQHASPYLTYHSTLKYAIQTDRQMKRFLTPGLLASPSWKIYEKQFNDMTALYKLYQAYPVPICDWAECPNLRSTDYYPLRICSGCELYYYCSEACQKGAWEARHREICPSYQESRRLNMCQATSSRDALFFSYITREVMRAHVNSDNSLVRHMDFRQCPPLVELRPVRSYETGEDASEYDRIKEGPNNQGIPMVSIMPMGEKYIKRSGRSDPFNVSYRGLIRYNPLTSCD
ncbi:hypothetical protein BDZ89DRAFT_534505 [Hymenopellis radicata]|nr:hypothetical protein BDZ89DRAFT_534505 [Hymenopellis radicata]